MGWLDRVTQNGPMDNSAPPAFSGLVGMTSVEFRGDLWHYKTRIPRLLCGVVCVIRLEGISITPTCGRKTQSCDPVPRYHRVDNSGKNV